MKKLYVVGNPIDHSLSPIMHNAALRNLGLDKEYQYNALLLKKKDLASFVESIRQGKIQGASITAPFKEKILEFIDLSTKEVELIQAANTVYHKDGLAVGHNTDGIGCIRSLKESGINLNGKNVLLLGAGGAAKAITVSLLLNDVRKLCILNRTIEKTIHFANQLEQKIEKNIIIDTLDQLPKYIEKTDIIINATSVGMKGLSENESLVPASFLHSRLIILDIVYNPLKTAFLREAEKKGATTIDGVGMLVYQGAEQFKIFTGENASIAIMKKAVYEALK